MTTAQQAKFEAIKATHPEAVAMRVSDERTGRRFGNAKKRQGMAIKIGSGGRNGKFRGAYQLWASWAPCDIA